jgi:hypothetical protein
MRSRIRWMSSPSFAAQANGSAARTTGNGGDCVEIADNQPEVVAAQDVCHAPRRLCRLSLNPVTLTGPSVSGCRGD